MAGARGKRLTKAEQVLMAERRRMAMELAAQHFSYEEIMKISQRDEWKPWPYTVRQSVGDDIKAALRQADAERNAMAGVYIQAMLEEIRQMKIKLWNVMRAKHYVVNQGVIVYMGISSEDGQKRGWNSVNALRDDLIKNPDGSFKEPLEDDKPVIECCLALDKLQDKEAKLLGLYAPVKKQIDVMSGGNIDDRIKQVLGELGELATRGEGKAPTGSAAPAIGTQAQNPR